MFNGATLSATYRVTHEVVVSKNVLGRLPGATKPDETLLYSAHWDHFGIRPLPATGDRILNGAVDNGTGVAALLELGRLFGSHPRTARSIVFMAATAEERGLLGSEYYATTRCIRSKRRSPTSTWTSWACTDPRKM